MPLIGILIAAIAYGNPSHTNLHIGIVNHDQGKMALDTIKFLEGLENIEVSQINLSQIDDKITAGTLDCVITFDDHFSESVLVGDPKGISITSIKGAEITSFVKSYLYNYINNIVAISKAAQGDQSIFEKMYQQYQASTFKLTTTTLKDTSSNKSMTNQSIGFLIMIMLMSAGNMSEIIIKERENRTYFRLLSSPIDAKKYVFSNIVVNMMVMFVQILITLFVMTKVFHITSGVPYWQMVFVMVIFAVVAVGLSLMIVAFSTNSNSAGAMQNLIFTPTCLLAGCFWPFEIMPETIQKMAQFLPQRWVLDTLAELQTGAHFASLYLNFMILFAFAIAFFLISIYKFGRNNSARNFI